jgi:positive phototaxis protein PixI
MLPSLDSVLTIASLDPFTLDTPPEESRQRLLSFPLGVRGNSLLPLEQITEILRINLSDILRVPETPSCVLGAYNWRGDMLWLVDLEQLIGCSPLREQCSRNNCQPTTVIVRMRGFNVGLVVRQVNDIELHDLQELLPPKQGLFAKELLPFIEGYLPEGSTVLNLQAIDEFFSNLEI